MEIYNNLKIIYEHLADDKSKEFFLNKALTSISGDRKYFSLFRDEKIENQINMAKKDIALSNIDSAYIFGCGDSSSFAFRLYGKNIVGFSDNKERLWGKRHFKLPIIPPKDIPKTAPIIISPRSKMAYTAIKMQLISLGFKEENLYIFTEICEKIYGKEYFGLKELNLGVGEIFVDAGCYDGGTSFEFIDFVKGDYKKIYAFEPDINSFKVCEKNLSELINSGKCKLFNNALREKEGDVSFLNKRNPGSCVGDGGNIIKAVSLDCVLKDEKVTFIKMDIEGSEYSALKGARNIIVKNHPKLAICIYHKPEDIFELPSLILAIDPSYKFYIRHYSPTDVSSVLYAV